MASNRKTTLFTRQDGTKTTVPPNHINEMSHDQIDMVSGSFGVIANNTNLNVFANNFADGTSPILADKNSKIEVEQSLSTDTIHNDQMYSLMISYETYEYPPFVSYRFTIFMDTGGAHPNHFLWTVVFDQEEERIISIADLEKKYPAILSIFSRYSREILMDNPGIVNSSMLFEGTKPTLENFSHFVFTSQGILIFFEHYQVAPYSSGEFQVLIPYEKIKKG